MTRKEKKKYARKCANRILALLPFRRNMTMKFVNMEDRFADISAEQKYFRAEIRFDLDRHNNRAEIEDTIVHEFMHLLVEPLEIQAKRLAKNTDNPKVHRKNVGDAVEEVTSAITETFKYLIFERK